jgi:hypothetical protein
MQHFCLDSFLRFPYSLIARFSSLAAASTSLRNRFLPSWHKLLLKLGIHRHGKTSTILRVHVGHWMWPRRTR